MNTASSVNCGCSYSSYLIKHVCCDAEQLGTACCVSREPVASVLQGLSGFWRHSGLSHYASWFFQTKLALFYTLSDLRATTIAQSWKGLGGSWLKG